MFVYVHPIWDDDPLVVSFSSMDVMGPPMPPERLVLDVSMDFRRGFSNLTDG
jgi:hypothetical protein